VSQRTQRVDELLREEIGQILSREMADPRIGFATITDVETTPDLRHARVWVSVIGQPAERQATIVALSRAMPHIRHELGVRLRLKRIPEFHVQLDDSAERGTRVLRLIQELEEGHTPDDAGVDEALPTPVARLPHEGDAAEEPPAEAVAKPARRSPRRRSKPTGRPPRRR
jgi:ribosome-binding factor A